jgi:hypothetical protein
MGPRKSFIFQFYNGAKWWTSYKKIHIKRQLIYKNIKTIVI